MKPSLWVASILAAFGAPAAVAAGVFGYAAGHPADEDPDRYRAFLDYLEVETGEPQRLIVDSYERLRVRLLAGELDLAILSPLNYVLTKRADVDNRVRLLARLEKGGQSHYQSSVIVHRDFVGGGRDIGALTFLYPTEASTSGFLYPLALLQDAGQDVEAIRRAAEPAGKYRILERVSRDATVFGAASNATLEAAEAQGIPVSKLFKYRTSPDEIPYDALVVYRGPRQSAYEVALSPFLLEESGDETERHRPEIGGITGFLPARDLDYDPVRQRLARVNGGQVLRVGLSTALEPTTESGKRRAFRPLQLHLFNELDLFLKIQHVYGESESGALIADLRRGSIDLGELPPVPTGRAIADGLVPILTPVYDGRHYTSVLIRRKGDASIRDASDLRGARLALGVEGSASAHVYPLRYLEKHCGLRERDLTLEEGLSADEIITAVAMGRADAGVLARFRLEAAVGNGHRFAEEVELVPDFDVRIPNGGYVLSRALSGDRDTHTELRDHLAEAARTVDPPLRPGLETMKADDRDALLEHYRWAHPKDRRPLALLLTATAVVALVSVIFLRQYRPEADDGGDPENQPESNG